MYEERIQKAVAAHKSGCNCCQAVLAAFADLYGFNEEQARKMGAGMGRGMGLKETCGALVGAFMLAGMEKGSPECNRQLNDRFAERVGGTVCRELLAQTGCMSCTEKVRVAAEIFSELKS